MGWKFWQKKKLVRPAAAAPEAWPTDTCGALHALVRAFDANDAPPFTLWRETQPTPRRELAKLSELACTGLVLRQWFARFQDVFGPLPARMAQDAFCRLLDSQRSDTALGDAIESLLSACDEALATYQRVMEDPPVSEDGQRLDPGFHMFLACSMLTRVTSSPYFQATPPDQEVDDLATLLERVSQETHALWDPVVDGITSFDPAGLPWKWSAEPGAHERHLQRRCGNPLFPAPRQEVTGADVLAARQKDEDARSAVCVQLGRLCVELLTLSQDGMTLEFLGKLLHQVCDVHREVLRAGSQQESVKEVFELRDRLVDAIHAVGEPADLGDTADIAVRHPLTAIVEDGWQQEVAWMLQSEGSDSPIPSEEMDIALLCESAGDVAKAVSVLKGSPPLHAFVRDGAARAMRQAVAQGHDVQAYRENLALLEAPL